VNSGYPKRSTYITQASHIPAARATLASWGGRGPVGGMALFIYSLAHTRGFLDLTTVYINSHCLQ